MGLTCNLHGKKGGPEILLRSGGAKNFRDKYFLHQAPPPYKCLWTVPNMKYNPFQQQDQTNSEALHVREFTHMNILVFLLRPD